MLRKLSFAALLALTFAPAFGQAPPAVPALPDSERRTSYSISGTTCACSVGFALYGDSTDFQNWIEVYLNGVRVNYNDSTYGWTITSATGSLATIPRPVTDGLLTFTNAQTGTVQIVGARRPRRTSTFSENRGVAARDLNQILNDMIAQNRETWDKTNDLTGRMLLGLPGESIATMPGAATRAGKFLYFDGTGLIPQFTTGAAGTGNVVGPASSVVGHFATWANTAGTLLQDTATPFSGTPGPGFVPAASSSSAVQWSAEPVNVKTMGAKGDTLGPNQFMYDGAITTGTKAFTSTNATFLSSDVGKVIRIQPASTVTITNASPGVISWTNHGQTAGTQIVFSTTGTLPSPLVAGNVYFVISAGLGTNSFEVSATSGGSAIVTTTNGSGVHTARAGVLLDTTISAFTSAHAVTLAANAAGTYSGAKFWYGTDDTAAIQAAINAAQAPTTASTTPPIGSACVYLPAVPTGYIITTALSVTSTACIRGDIGPYIGAASQIIPGLGINGITANTGGVFKLSDVGIYYPVPANNGTYAIDLTTVASGSDYFNDIRDVMVWNADTAIASQTGSSGTVDNFRSYYSRIGAVVQSAYNVDANPIQIINSTFLGQQLTSPGSTCIVWNSGGAFKFINNDCAFYYYGVQFVLASGAGTSQATISHNNFDNGAVPSGTALVFTRSGATGSHGSVIIDGNICNYVQVCVSVPTDANGAWLTGVNIVNNMYVSASSGTFAAIDTAAGILLGNNTLITSNSAVPYNIGATVTNCSIGVNTLSGTFSASTFTSPCGATIPGPLTLSSALTYGGVTLTNAVTGTGKMVLSSNPTFTTDVIVTATSGTSFSVGPNGVTNPTFNVDASAGSAVAGLNVKGAASGGTVAISTTDSGSNNNLTINAKGSGTIGIGTISTGNITLGTNSTSQLTVNTAAAVFATAGSQSLVVGPNGTTNPTLQVDDSTASAATGLYIKSAAAGGGLALSVTSSGAAENLTINAKGTGTIGIGNVSTGAVTISPATTISAASAAALNLSAGAATIAGDGTSLIYSSATNLSIMRLTGNGGTFYYDFGTGGANAVALVYRATNSFTNSLALFASTSAGAVAINSGSQFGTLYVNGNGQFNTTSTTGTGLNVGGTAFFSGQVTHNPTTSVASAAGATLDDLDVAATSTTITGSTNITTATGFNKTSHYTPTYTSGSAVTISNAATLFVQNAPTAAGSVTITNAYALWVAGGTSLFGGNLLVSTTAGITSGGVISATLSAASGTSTVCNTAGTKTNLTLVASGTACASSAMRFKNLLPKEPLNLAGLSDLRTDRAWSYRKDSGIYENGLVHVGLLADDVERMDKRCVVYDEQGKLLNYYDRCIETYLVAAVKEMKYDNDNLRREVEQLKRYAR